jgi:hypothetical protein
MQLSADILLQTSGKTHGQQKPMSANVVKCIATKTTDYPNKDFVLSYYTLVLNVCSMSQDEEAPSVAQVI